MIFIHVLFTFLKASPHSVNIYQVPIMQFCVLPHTSHNVKSPQAIWTEVSKVKMCQFVDFPPLVDEIAINHRAPTSCLQMQMQMFFSTHAITLKFGTDIYLAEGGRLTKFGSKSIKPGGVGPCCIFSLNWPYNSHFKRYHNNILSQDVACKDTQPPLWIISMYSLITVFFSKRWHLPY